MYYEYLVRRFVNVGMSRVGKACCALSGVLLGPLPCPLLVVPVPRCRSALSYRNPRSSLASSLIMSFVHSGSNTTSTLAFFTSGMLVSF